MRDLCLAGVFLLCAGVVYLAVSRAGNFLEYTLFQDMESCYNNVEKGLSEIPGDHPDKAGIAEQPGEWAPWSAKRYGA